MIEAPKVDDSIIDAEYLKGQLQTAINLIADVATTIGKVPVEDTFDNRHLRAIAEHFTNIRMRLVKLAADEMPF